MNQLLDDIRDAAYEVRLNLAPGYLESVYRNALVLELQSRGMKAETEVALPVKYKGQVVGDFRADILVNDCVILELKAVRELSLAHEAQLVNYLIASGIDNGFLINYGGDKFRIMQKTRIYNPHKQ